MINSQFAIAIPSPLAVIPVLDVKGGLVVRAVGGRREQYAPLTTPLVSGSNPLDVARALATTTGQMQLYLADLDAIEGGQPAWDTYRSLLAANLDVWLDAGLATVERAVAISELREKGRSIFREITALESLPDLQTLASIVSAVGVDRLVFSLDLIAGEPITSAPSLKRLPLALVDDVVSLGIQRMIVLDLAAVGKREGPRVLDLCRQIHCRAPHVELIAGGGVRGVEDLACLRAVGASRALVSSWLHEANDH